MLGRHLTNNYETAVSFAYVTIVVGELMRGYSARSEKKFIFKMNPFSNKYLNYSVIIGIGLLLVTVYAPGVNQIFRTVPLEMNYFAIAFFLGFGPLIGGEISKKFK